MRSSSFLLTCLFCLSAAGNVSGEELAEWPQFRGPDGQGRISATTLPTEWDREAGVSWRAEIQGLGHSSPVHDGRTVWVTTAAPDGTAMGAIGVAAETGEELHSIVIFRPQQVEPIHQSNSYASPSPVLHDNRLYVHYGTYGTACLDTQSGQIVWQNNSYHVDHQGGPGSSPVLFEDLLIITLDGAEMQKLVAFDAATGEVRWERERTAPFRPDPVKKRAFSTPLVIDYNGKPQLISVGADQVHAYDPRTGGEIWHIRYEGYSTVPRPVRSGDVIFFCTGFDKPQLWCIDLGGRGDVTDTHVKWKFRGPVPEIPSPVVIDDQVIVISNKGVLTSVDASTGERRWFFRVGGNHSASPLAVGHHIYFCSEEGIVKVIDIQGEKPEVVSVNRMDERILASPAVIGSDLLIRTDQSLYRISGKKMGAR